jgi:hypothetical protein
MMPILMRRTRSWRCEGFDLDGAADGRVAEGSSFFDTARRLAWHTDSGSSTPTLPERLEAGNRFGFQ